MNQEQEILRVQLRGVLLDLLRQIENLDSEQLDGVVFRLEQLASHIIRLCDVNLVNDDIQYLVTAAMQNLQRAEQINSERPFQTDVVHSGTAGRPYFDISQEQLNYFLNYQFSVPDIARALGVSKSTIFRRMNKYGLAARNDSPLISDEELDSKVQEILTQFPNAGYRRVISQLSVAEVKPSQIRVRQSMQRVDPQGVAVRWLRLTPRRKYSVSGPLALWHIDGNHKLIRYCMILLILTCCIFYLFEFIEIKTSP